MSIDRYAAERRRFARLLGTDDELGSGLPIGDVSSRDGDAKSDGGRHLSIPSREDPVLPDADHDLRDSQSGSQRGTSYTGQNPDRN
ncbi:hypothetical protein [Natrialba swarupiae]|uniref:Uncharacterized protein n=1 Tax=Natrialba swarupiae TaxID=2448032 RepID=A0A5D5APC6_9EURY|nr:hypothetical protein [Natrialba swarupiae]TYT62914.1 hypothetical protein FYC77_06260 [Natrialba swarupiae]